jgi:hypothetical protein
MTSHFVMTLFGKKRESVMTSNSVMGSDGQFKICNGVAHLMMTSPLILKSNHVIR